MNVVLLHDALRPEASPDEADVFAQIATIRSALTHLGHDSSTLACSLDLNSAAKELRRARPDLVFNLVESIGGQGRLIHLAPALLDTLELSYTGCPTDAIYCTSNKLLAKRLLKASGIPTPDWLTLSELRDRSSSQGGRFIIKSVWEHASRGLDEDSVIESSNTEQLVSALERRLASLGGEGFCERYIEGREFNLSVLAGEVLPTAEIDFGAYEPGKLRVVGYRAKWDESSFEYHHTPRRFGFAPGDADLIRELQRLALQCWDVFGLRGYARVDFRVDANDKPWVLEVNTNPCLSPEAGFAAAVERAGMSFAGAVQRIIGDTFPPRAKLDSRPRPVPETPEQPSERGRETRVQRVMFREDPRPSDAAAVRDIVASTGFFHDFEIDVAVELVEERLLNGLASEYYFVFADDENRKTIGYACFGPIACTVGSFDLFWIAVHDSCRGQGLGRRLMHEAETRMAAGLAGPKGERLSPARRVYIETSSQTKYEPTRAFYLRCGYTEEARFRDFYASGDDKVVYVKALD